MEGGNGDAKDSGEQGTFVVHSRHAMRMEGGEEGSECIERERERERMVKECVQRNGESLGFGGGGNPNLGVFWGGMDGWMDGWRELKHETWTGKTRQ